MVTCTAAEAAATVLRDCVRKDAEGLIAWILHHEFERFLVQFRAGNAVPSAVRNGFQPARSIMTGLGMLTVRYPKVRSKNGRSVIFRSQLVPRYAHCAQDRSDAAEWKCLDAVRNENLAGVLCAAFGARGDQVAHVVPELAAKWAESVRAWKKRSLAEHSDQDLWMLTVSSPNYRESVDMALTVAIAVSDGGEKRMLSIVPGHAGFPLEVLGSLVESIQGRGFTCPKRIYSNWPAWILGDGLRCLAPQWATRVVLHETDRGGKLKESAVSVGWDRPAAVHQN